MRAEAELLHARAVCLKIRATTQLVNTDASRGTGVLSVLVAVVRAGPPGRAWPELPVLAERAEAGDSILSLSESFKFIRIRQVIFLFMIWLIELLFVES